MLNCYRLMEKLSLSMNLKVERNTGLEQSIKTCLLETDSQLTEAESRLQEFRLQEQNASAEDKLMVRSRYSLIYQVQSLKTSLDSIETLEEPGTLVAKKVANQMPTLFTTVLRRCTTNWVYFKRTLKEVLGTLPKSRTTSTNTTPEATDKDKVMKHQLANRSGNCLKEKGKIICCLLVLKQQTHCSLKEAFL